MQFPITLLSPIQQDHTGNGLTLISQVVHDLYIVYFVGLMGIVALSCGLSIIIICLLEFLLSQLFNLQLSNECAQK